MSVLLPKWYTNYVFSGNELVVLNTETEHVAILSKYTRDVIWDSKCETCKGFMGDVFFFPRHKRSSPCQGGGDFHCTCDGCF